MNRNSLWTYCLFGSVLGGIALALFSLWIAPRYLYPNPEYLAFDSLNDRFQDWREKNNNMLAQALIERRMIGAPVEVPLTGNAEIIAAGLNELRNSSPANNTTLMNILTRNKAGEFYAVLNQFYECNNGKCGYNAPLTFLNEPEKVKRLLAGDQSALTEGLPMAYPAEFAPVIDKQAPPKTSAKPWWLAKAKWLVFSLFCAFGFFVLGMIQHVGIGERRDPTWTHPTRSVPDYLIGWAVIASFLPGYLMIQFLYWSIVLANASVTPVLARAKASVFKPRPFEDIYSDVETQLRALEDSVKDKPGNEASLKLIREALARVQDNRDRDELAQVAQSVEHLKDTIDGIASLSRA